MEVFLPSTPTSKTASRHPASGAVAPKANSIGAAASGTANSNNNMDLSFVIELNDDMDNTSATAQPHHPQAMVEGGRRPIEEQLKICKQAFL